MDNRFFSLPPYNIFLTWNSPEVPIHLVRETMGTKWIVRKVPQWGKLHLCGEELQVGKLCVCAGVRSL